MKTKIVFLSFICLFIVSTNVSASSFSSFYPGGKNYLEIENFMVNGDTITSIDDIRVKSGTTYTLSIPGDGNIEEPYFFVRSNSTTYLNEYADNSTNCVYASVFTVCTFTTTATDEYISIELDGTSLGSMFTYYNGSEFQLEEGTLRTEYEEYIIPLIDSNNPEFSGSAAFIMTYYDNFNIEDIINDHIFVIDDIDGDISENTVIVSDNYTQNKHVVGEYLVELQAADESGNVAYFNLTIVIKDEIFPSISGPQELNVNVDDNLSIETIISNNYSGIDGYDGNIAISSTYDDYSSNNSIVGSYDVTLNTTDSSGNSTTKNVLISVVDMQGPVLESSNTIDVYMSEPKDILTLLSELSFSDNYYPASQIVPTILSDEYTNSSNVIGSKNVELLIEDGSLNSTYITLNINVIDDIAPIISGPTSYSMSYTQSYSISDIINLFSFSDNYSELSADDITVTLDTYTTRNTEVGTFVFEMKLIDLSLNTTTHSLEITVVDDQAPIIYMDDYLVTLSENVTFTPNDALSILVNNHELPNKSYDIIILTDEYSGNESKSGTYLYSLLFTDTEGKSLQKDFIVKVQEESKLVDTSLIVRNIIVYTATISIFGFVVYKNKK